MPDPGCWTVESQPIATSIGRYRLERVLGTGSFATVWLAEDELLDRRVAIKVLADNWSRDPDVHRRFLAEAQVLLDAESTRITRGYELGDTDDGTPYLVMTWADRGTLADRLQERMRTSGPFAVDEAVAIAREVALALADVHALGHLHRDVKPSNVLLRSSDTATPVPGLAPDEVVLLGDFGLARSIERSAITMVAGSPGYVAPEQARGLVHLDVRTDLYSLGPLLLELLTGDPGSSATTMARAAEERIDVDAALDAHHVDAPPGLVELIKSLVSFDREQRPSSALDVAARLAGDLGTAAPPVTPRRRRGRVAVVGGGVLALGLAGAGVLLFDGGDDPAGGNGTSTTLAADAPLDVPLPPAAIRDERASDDTRIVATVALPVDDVVAFYTDDAEPWTVSGNPTQEGDAAELTLSDGARQARVRVEPTALTAGEGISRIVIDAA